MPTLHLSMLVGPPDAALHKSTAKLLYMYVKFGHLVHRECPSCVWVYRIVNVDIHSPLINNSDIGSM